MMKTIWEHMIIEEGNPPALQARMRRAGLDGWEAVGLGYAGECRLLALLKRAAEFSPRATRPSPTAGDECFPSAEETRADGDVASWR
jgi:hypothetical protein